jgi:hypothetical protein
MHPVLGIYLARSIADERRREAEQRRTRTAALKQAR